jgi:hypothetical protein
MINASIRFGLDGWGAVNEGNGVAYLDSERLFGWVCHELCSWLFAAAKGVPGRECRTRGRLVGSALRLFFFFDTHIFSPREMF